jgi:hypothetical protein
MNRHFVSLMCVSLLASGSALAAPQTAGAKSAPPPAADHANMQMGGMPMEHGAMQMKPKAELPAKNPLSAHFGMFDADKDGSLTLAEFVSMRGM